MRLTSVNNIFLVGPMGVGKTTIGRMLARELGLEFFDSDREIERRAGANISWIFDVEGEDSFRDRESQVIDELSKRSGVLLATGGGSVLRPGNRRCLQSRGLVLFLDTSLELQLKRTAKDRQRPLLQNADREDVLKKMKEQRQQIYDEVSDLKIFVGEGSSRRIVNGIVGKLVEEGYLED